MRKKNKTYIRKPLLTLNDLLIIIGCTGFIIGLVFYVNYIITMDELNSSPKAQIIKNVKFQMVNTKLFMTKSFLTTLIINLK